MTLPRAGVTTGGARCKVGTMDSRVLFCVLRPPFPPPSDGSATLTRERSVRLSHPSTARPPCGMPLEGHPMLPTGGCPFKLMSSTPLPWRSPPPLPNPPPPAGAATPRGATRSRQATPLSLHPPRPNPPPRRPCHHRRPTDAPLPAPLPGAHGPALLLSTTAAPPPPRAPTTRLHQRRRLSPPLRLPLRTAGGAVTRPRRTAGHDKPAASPVDNRHGRHRRAWRARTTAARWRNRHKRLAVTKATL